MLAFNDELSGILSPLEGGCTFEGFIRLVPDLFELRKRYLFNVERELTKLFSRDISTINAELSKYKEVLVEEDGVVKSPKTRRVRSYFMKSKETANARMGAHLCIAGDHTMWTNRNYFELVTKDEDTDECVSVVMLLDIKTKSGKRYLWFGPNPFNSFMDKVPVKACYDYLYGVVTDFAAQNGFDGVVVPDERRIVGECTNREGEFPECIKRSMLRDDNGRLKWVDFENTHMLSRGQYKYGYEDGILIWERGL